LTGEWRAQVNGREVTAEGLPDDERLLDTLRWRLGLRGTKEGCRTGDCGACTVLVDDRTTLSCLVLSREVEGQRIATVEGAEADEVGCDVQRAFERAVALQCGYCTPGFVMALIGLLKERGRSTPAEELIADLQSNLCRCTGYASIARAVRAVARGSR
jgi:aerobic carbon-monoxide dehydrogenase small subunit